MTLSIDYFFTLSSPWSYLGHEAFMSLCNTHDIEIRYRPVNMSDVFVNSGAVPVPLRPVSRQNYRFVELQRWREFRNVPVNLHPAYFPVDPGLADAAAATIYSEGKDPGNFMLLSFQAVWVKEQDLADKHVVRTMLSTSGHDAASIFEKARSAEIESVIVANTKLAIANNIVGAPGYLLNGEPFWGQDRIELLEEAIKSARPPYAHDA